MNRIARFFALFALLCALPACHVESPYAPEVVVGGYVPAPEPEPVGYPPITGPARVFEYDAEATNSSDANATWNVNTRYVLYEDGTFALQSKRWGSNQPGFYTEREAGEILLWWKHAGSGPAQEATGRLEGDLLHIAYNEIMLISDFANGSYRLVR